jgi:membrane-associated protease RseP (regulator of RpoE activity)
VQVAIESGEAIAVQSLRDGNVGLSLGAGLGVEVKSPLADVRVDPRGFVVTSPNLASRAGLQVGDRIVEVNGTPIDGIGSLIRAYQQVKGNASLGTVRVTVERNDQPITLTYRIR